jgi:hypothetical protein
MKGLVILATCSLLLTACGNEPDPDTAATALPEATTTAAEPTTTTTETTTTTTEAVDFGELYLDLVARTNCTSARANEILDRLGDTTDWSRFEGELLPSFRDYSSALIAFYEGLLANTWPDNVQGDVEQLAVETSADAAAVSDWTNATSLNDLVARIEERPLSTSNIAGIVRAKLGLPSNIIDDGTDWCARAGI